MPSGKERVPNPTGDGEPARKGVAQSGKCLSKAEKLQLLVGSDIFKGTSPVDVIGLVARATVLGFEKGNVIFRDGDPADFFYMVHEGLVEVNKTSESGRNVVFAIATRGDALIPSALLAGSYFAFAEALSDVTVIGIDKNEFLRFVAAHENTAMQFLSGTARSLSREYERTLCLLNEKAQSRLARALRVLVDKLGPTFFLTRRRLADFIGTRPETTTRLLSTFKKKGFIDSTTGGKIIVTDVTKLDDCL